MLVVVGQTKKVKRGRVTKTSICQPEAYHVHYCYQGHKDVPVSCQNADQVFLGNIMSRV